MSNKTIRIILLLMLLTIFGLFITQMYWFKKSFSLEEKQFDDKVNVALRNVAHNILVLNNDTISGTFQISEVLRGTINDESDIFIKATITGIPSTTSLTNDGSLYTEADSLTVTGGGQGAIVQVDAVGRGFADSGRLVRIYQYPHRRIS